MEGGEDHDAVVCEARERAKAYLRRRQRSFVWDATHVTKDMRSGLIALFANYGAAARIVYVEAPLWEATFARNRVRERTVPEAVVCRLP